MLQKKVDPSSTNAISPHPNCDLMEHLATTCIVSGVVIKQDGKYLLVQENRPSNAQVHGLWNFPAGRVDEGDTIEETAIKEAKEEAGYDVELIRKLGIFQAHSKTPPKHAFQARIIGGSLQFPPDEILDARWFTREEIENMKDKIRSERVLGAIEILEKSN